ncbi:MAG: hypothetical protein QOH47_2374 [Sphingomonadales bacterium]|jgi:hypothetical protein|nr:hypothetical protein [Sphingomonadales bacterium]
MSDEQATVHEAEAVAAPELPDGNYAIVEVLGHRTYVGRVAEVERFGSKMLQVEALFKGQLLDPLLIGGGSIYQFTPCSKEVAAKRGPTRNWDLPASALAIVPPALLPEPEPSFAPEFDDEPY